MPNICASSEKVIFIPHLGELGRPTLLCASGFVHAQYEGNGAEKSLLLTLSLGGWDLVVGVMAVSLLVPGCDFKGCGRGGDVL